MSDITSNENYSHDSSYSVTCPTTVEKRAIVSVPASIKPFAVIGPIEACCGGEPAVTPGWNPIGHKNCSCDFTVSQEISVRIPICFGADIIIGDVYAECVIHPGPLPPHGKTGGNNPDYSDTDDGCGCGNGKGK
ncbi:MAG: hypothetical protein LBN00_03505 [Oscillospiraceae bacterium]|jgi:hypothetical protein|nr:hypothetical protein [Oscillospiraceae bacterium]